MALHSRQRFEQWLPAAFDGQFDWDFLAPAFDGTKIMPMDFDAVVERNGKVLIYETKAAGCAVGIGQGITLTNEWRRGSSIIHIEGKTPSTIESCAFYWPGAYIPGAKFGSIPLAAANFTDVLFKTRQWFCWASGSPIPSREEWDNALWLMDYEGRVSLKPREANESNIPLAAD